MQSSFLEFLQDRVVLRNAIASLILIGSVVGFRYIALRFIRRKLPSRDSLQLRSAAQLRGFSYVILAFGLFIIWAAELQALAVSFVVLAMAIVWATKETLACVQGGMYRISSNAFEVGDRINIAGIRGDVIEPGLLSTLVLEVAQGHQRTGRTISIPNSLFMTEPVLNESLAGEYMLHLMTIPVDRSADLAAIESQALTAAQEACADFLDDVRRPIAISPPRVDPANRRPAGHLSSSRQEHGEYPTPNPNANQAGAPSRAARPQSGARCSEGPGHAPPARIANTHTDIGIGLST
jgi:small-conductance mechanosensitive channel